MTRRDEPRALPYDVDLEQALLGALMVEENAYWQVADRVAPHEFYDPLHRRMYEAIGMIAAVNIAPSPMVLADKLGADEGLVEVGGKAYLTSLARGAPAMANIKDYAATIRRIAQRRFIIQISRDAIDAAYGADMDSGDPSVLADSVSEKLYEATHGSDPGEGPISLSELSYRALKEAEAALADPKSVCLTSGLNSVDEKLGMIYRGDLLVVGAATSMGKTSLVQKILRANVQPGTGHAALMFSLEMRGESMATRYMAEDTRVSSSRIRQGKITEGEFDRLARQPGLYAEIGDRFKIDSTPGLSVAQIRARAHAYRRKQPGLALIVIDHLQYIRAADPRATTDEQARQITRDLCALAKELNVAIILISHLTKDNERRNSKRPIMADLYGSGGIAQNADSVWFVYRAHYYLAREEPDASEGKAYDAWAAQCEKTKGRAEIFSTKVRMGAVDSVHVGFDEQFTSFYDLEPAKGSPLTEQESLALAGW